MKQDDRNLWIAATIGIAAALLSTSGMTIIVIAFVSRLAAPPTALGGTRPLASDLIGELVLGAFMSLLTLFMLAQIVARRYLLFERWYARPVSSALLPLFTIATLILTVVFAVLMGHTVERIRIHGGESITGNSFFPGLGSMSTLLAMMWANLAGSFFMSWKQSSPRDQLTTRVELPVGAT